MNGNVRKGGGWSISRRIITFALELKRRNMKGFRAELETIDTPIKAWEVSLSRYNTVEVFFQKVGRAPSH